MSKIIWRAVFTLVAISKCLFAASDLGPMVTDKVAMIEEVLTLNNYFQRCFLCFSNNDKLFALWMLLL